MLFPSHWDRRHFSHPRYQGRYEFIFFGEQLWCLPCGVLRILGFDPVRFIDRVVRKFRRARIDGVLSNDEYVGGAIAAAVARSLGLPGADPIVIVELQHKYLARKLQQRITPGAVPHFQLISVPPPKLEELEVAFPCFVKPVRGSFSIFASQMRSYADLERHLAFSALWRLALTSVQRPYNQLLRHFTDHEVDANCFIAESLLRGEQVCVDGYVHAGKIHMLGIVDALMFPGTCAFERFQYPSRLPATAQARICAVVCELIGGLGIDQGQFNVELIYDSDRDEVGVIEAHQRLSYQFADLYEDVDGTNTYDILLDLAVGNAPHASRLAGAHKYSASLVIRKFNGRRMKRVPCRSSIDAFRSRHEGARIHIYAKKGDMSLEMRAMGSYRCALINVGADSLTQLSQVRKDADAMLRFEVE